MSKHILLIDDQPDLLRLMRMLLEDEHYQVSVLERGSEAVARVRENPPDLIVLDLRLPDASGVDILEGLRSQESTAEIPIIVYTAAPLAAESVANLIEGNPGRYGNTSVLQKPFELEALLGRVQQVLGVAPRP